MFLLLLNLLKPVDKPGVVEFKFTNEDIKQILLSLYFQKGIPFKVTRGFGNGREYLAIRIRKLTEKRLVTYFFENDGSISFQSRNYTGEKNQ